MKIDLTFESDTSYLEISDFKGHVLLYLKRVLAKLVNVDPTGTVAPNFA